jgi:hypothetical protein
MLLPRIAPNLTLRLGDARVRLTPSQGLRFAERLVRESMRQAMVEEALVPPPRHSRPRTRRAPVKA